MVAPIVMAGMALLPELMKGMGGGKKDEGGGGGGGMGAMLNPAGAMVAGLATSKIQADAAVDQARINADAKTEIVTTQANTSMENTRTAAMTENFAAIQQVAIASTVAMAADRADARGNRLEASAIRQQGAANTMAATVALHQIDAESKTALGEIDKEAAELALAENQSKREFQLAKMEIRSEGGIDPSTFLKNS